MNPKDYETRLREESFTHTCVWHDAPGVYYPDHTRLTDTTHIILDGEMTVTSEGKTQTY